MDTDNFYFLRFIYHFFHACVFPVSLTMYLQSIAKYFIINFKLTVVTSNPLKSYWLLPFYNKLRTQLRVFVTYSYSVWPKVSINILYYLIACILHIMTFHFTV